MLVHIGRQHSVAKNKIVAILRIDAKSPQTIQEYLDFLRVQGRLRGTDLEHARACVITEEGGYLSALGPKAIGRRINNQV